MTRIYPPLDLAQPDLLAQLASKFEFVDAGLEGLDHTQALLECIFGRISNLLRVVVNSEAFSFKLLGTGSRLRGGE